MLADYFLLRRRTLDVDALYDASSSGAYFYSGGYNPAALIALIVGVLPNLPGFLNAAGVLRSVAPLWTALYGQAWFLGFAVAMATYLALMRAPRLLPRS